MKEYDLYFPIRFNDGSKVPPKVLEHTKKLIVKTFGGLTDFQHKNKGTWKVGRVIYRDEILILRFFADNKKSTLKFLKKFKLHLAKQLHQEEILIVGRTVKFI